MIKTSVAILVFGVCFFAHINAQNVPTVLPVWNKQIDKITLQDWLVNPVTVKAQVYKSADEKDIILYNGLLKRVFRLQPNIACTDYTNLANGQQLLRAIKPEASITIDDKVYAVGGLHGQKENAYLLPEWINNYTAHDSDFHFLSYTVSDLSSFLNWKNNRWATNKKNASGKQLIFKYASSLALLKGIIVKVQYELYDGLPLIVKSISVENSGNHSFKINRVTNEILGLVEEESAVVGKPEEMKKQHGIYVETNYAFNNAMRYDISDQTTHWKTDPAIRRR